MAFHEPNFLVNILQQVQDLAFDRVCMDERVDLNRTVDEEKSKNHQLKALFWNFGCHKSNFQSFYAANKFIDFVLHSCPLLTEFMIIGDIYDLIENGALCIDVSHLTQLKSFEVNIEGLSYYILNTPGKKDSRWLDLDTPYMDSGHRNQDEAEFYVDFHRSMLHLLFCVKSGN